MRKDVETYEEAARKHAALAKQARLKEQAAKEQESKAKSFKDKKQDKTIEDGGIKSSSSILLLYILNIYQLIGYRIDYQSSCGVNL